MQSVVLDGNPLDEDDGNLLEYVLMNLLNDVNLMYLQWVQKVMKKWIKYVLDLWWKEYVSSHTRICLGEVAYAHGKQRAKLRMGKSAHKVQNQG